MKIFIFKESYNSYIIEPEPLNKEDFIEVEVNDLSIFDTHLFNGEEFVPRIREEYHKTLNEAKTHQQILISDTAQAFISRVGELDKLPEFEVKTWTKQADEARAWMENKDAPTPTLDAIALGRGMDRETLIIKAFYKAQVYETIVAYVSGTRQKYEAQIKNAKTIEEVKAIIPKYELPRGLIL